MHTLLQLGGKTLNPAGQGGVIDLHAAVGEHALEVTIADRELEVPAHRPEDDLGREAEAAERPGVGHGGALGGGCCGGAPLLPAHDAPLNATDPPIPKQGGTRRLG